MDRVFHESLSEIELHHFFHWFRAKSGCGTSTMELTLFQKLVAREQVPLYGLFCDLCKAFYVMDRRRCLKNFEDAGVRPKALRLIRVFREKSVLIYRASGYHGRAPSAMLPRAARLPPPFSTS